VVDIVGLAAGVTVPMAGVMCAGQAHVVERSTLYFPAKTLTRAYHPGALYLLRP
jgi:hypothetical protein